MKLISDLYSRIKAAGRKYQNRSLRNYCTNLQYMVIFTCIFNYRKPCLWHILCLIRSCAKIACSYGTGKIRPGKAPIDNNTAWADLNAPDEKVIWQLIAFMNITKQFKIYLVQLRSSLCDPFMKVLSGFRRHILPTAALFAGVAAK